ncbi:MAG: alpha/beta hydrolase [Streptococcaceae bacterium]|jgi:pimeloyl-ACP methyl ester carboxylesterase|nr:alpha/beta hydrolase [Streptococcaceae bacterium]
MQKKTVKSYDGTEIYYEIHGSAGKPILFINGNHVARTIFKGQMSAFLKAGYQIFLMDSRMQGDSGNVKNTLEYEDMARDVVALVQAENLVRPTVLGYSDGANVAMVTSVMFPELLGTLILNSGDLQPKGAILPVRIGIFFERLWTKLIGWMTRNDRAYQVVSLMVKPTPVTLAQLAQISNPALVICGQFDFIKRSESKSIAQAIPNSTFIVAKGMTHLFLVTHPNRFNRYVLDYLTLNEA